MDLPLIVPAFIALVALLILIQVARGVAEWAHNNSLPVQSVPARVVAKRTEMRGRGSHYSGRRVWTTYFVTFELDSGERLEFGLYGQAYGLIAEGDRGVLTYQGTRYHGFQRQR